MRVTLARVLATLAAALTLAVAASVVAPREARAQQPVAGDTATADSTKTYVLRTRDGSMFIGRLIRASVDTVYFVSAGGPITIPRTSVIELKQIGKGAMREGVFWPPSPGDTRLFFAPTGRMLQKGEGYFNDTYLFFLSVVGGITSRITMGAGFSVFPVDDFTQNVFYVTPKVGLVQRDKFNLALGALVGYAGFDLFDDNGGDVGKFGIVYGVGTAGSPDGSVTAGAGLGYGRGGFADRPVVMLGADKRVARRASLVTENYFLPGETGALISYGVRFFGEKLSVDLAFWNGVGGGATTFFPGIPYVAFSVRF